MASRPRNYLAIFWALALCGLAADLYTKYAVFEWKYGGPGSHNIHNVVEGVFRFEVRYTAQPIDEQAPLAKWQKISAPFFPEVNHGALWGFGQNANHIFAIISFLAAAGIIIWSLLPGSRSQGWMCCSLGLVLAGTLGNFYDRIVFDGVRDFLHWYKWINWAVFNIADVCLVVGASMLMLEAFFHKPEEAEQLTPTLAEAGSKSI